MILPKEHHIIGHGSYGQVFGTTDKAIAVKVFNTFRDGFHEYTCLKQISNHSPLKISAWSYTENDQLVYFDNNCNNILTPDTSDKSSTHTHISNSNDRSSAITSPIITTKPTCLKNNRNEVVLINLPKYDCNLTTFKQQANYLKIIKYSTKSLVFNILASYYPLYSNFLIHGDIKLANILVKTSKSLIKSHQIALCDFSLSFNCLDQQLNNDFLVKDLVYFQTVTYRAPEIIFGLNNFNSVADIWSLAIVILKIHPDINEDYFNSKTENQQRQLIVKTFGLTKVKQFCEKYKLPIDNLPKRNYKACLSTLLNKIQNRQLADLLSRMLELDPYDRIQYHQIFSHPYFEDYGHYTEHLKVQRNPKLYLDNHFARQRAISNANQNDANQNDANQNDLLSQNDRLIIFRQVFQFLATANVSIRLLFLTIDNYDYLVASHKITSGYYQFLAILKIIAANQFEFKEFKPLLKDMANNYPSIINNHNMNIDQFESLTYNILINIRDDLEMWTYLDYYTLNDESDVNVKIDCQNYEDPIWDSLISGMARGEPPPFEPPLRRKVNTTPLLNPRCEER